jgi:hypothetical protein
MICFVSGRNQLSEHLPHDCAQSVMMVKMRFFAARLYKKILRLSCVKTILQLMETFPNSKLYP